VLVVRDDLRAITARSFQFHTRRIRRHDDHRGGTEQLPRKRDRLRMIPRRIGEDSAPALRVARMTQIWFTSER